MYSILLDTVTSKGTGSIVVRVGDQELSQPLSGDRRLKMGSLGLDAGPHLLEIRLQTDDGDQAGSVEELRGVIIASE